MADVKLSDGREIDFDFLKMTVGEYDSLFEPETEKDENRRILASVIGFTLEEIKALPYPDYKRIARVFFKKASEPDPN